MKRNTHDTTATTKVYNTITCMFLVNILDQIGWIKILVSK